MLAQHLQVPPKRLQYFNATCCNIVGRNMLRAFGHPVVSFCDMLGIENQTSAHALVQHYCTIWPNDHSIMQHPQMLHENLTIFKFEPTIPNLLQLSQPVATGWLNAHNVLHTTMLRYVALKCCDRLAGALRGFFSYAVMCFTNNPFPFTIPKG